MKRMTWLMLAAASLFGCKGIGPSQQASEECDPDLGVDACGAGLFCAKFDKRTVDTCYELHSRLEGEACNADDNCATPNCVGGVCGIKAAGPGDTGAPCAADSACKSGACIETNEGMVCE